MTGQVSIPVQYGEEVPMLPVNLPIRCCWYRSSSGWDHLDTRVIGEANVSLTVNGEIWLTFTCTPTHLDALAAGFLYNEGFLNERADIAALDVCSTGSNIDVWLHHHVTRPATWLRTSGCTGGMTSASDSAPTLQRTDSYQIDPELLLQSMEQLLESQELYREAHGIHCSALSDGQELRLIAEDIGRHNTLDKLSGMMLLEGSAFSPMIVLTTGRVSSDMLQKSARLGALAVVSRTSATSQSVAFAEQQGITLAGYARRGSFIIYAHPERLVNANTIPG